MMTCCAHILTILLAAIPPLTVEQVARVRTADASRDHQEDAFVALLENATGWEGDAADVPAHDNPGSVALLDDPAAYRGELFRIAGELQQITRLKRPYDAVYEWFVRLPTGTRIIVYVAAMNRPDDFKVGHDIQVPGRFYKVMTMTDRSGQEREYPAFVGARPSRTVATTDQLAYLWMVGLPLVAMLVVFFLLLGYVRRRRRAESAARAARPWRDPIEDAASDEPPLPPDPAEALAELRRRAEAAE